MAQSLRDLLSVASAMRHSGVGEVALFDLLQGLVDHIEPAPKETPAADAPEPEKTTEPEAEDEKPHGHPHKSTHRR